MCENFDYRVAKQGNGSGYSIVMCGIGEFQTWKWLPIGVKWLRCVRELFDIWKQS